MAPPRREAQGIGGQHTTSQRLRLTPTNAKRAQRASAVGASRGLARTTNERRTRGASFPQEKRQMATTALLEIFVDKLRADIPFAELTTKRLQPDLEAKARELEGLNATDQAMTHAQDRCAFPNVLRQILQNSFRKVGVKERLGARSVPDSRGAQGRDYAPVLANFAPSDDLAADMEQLWRGCVAAGLSDDMLDAVRQMRHFQFAPVLAAGNAFERRGAPLPPGDDSWSSVGAEPSSLAPAEDTEMADAAVPASERASGGTAPPSPAAELESGDAPPSSLTPVEGSETAAGEDDGGGMAPTREIPQDLFYSESWGFLTP